ncbi:hypothetical protein N9948_00565 [bacterium]|nr:hypothetical protein [bacterium]
MDAQDNKDDLEDDVKFNLVKESFYSLLHNAVLFPMVYGNQKDIAHFKLSYASLGILSEHLNEIFKGFDVKVKYGWFYTCTEMRPVYYDIIVYKDIKKYEEFENSFEDLCEGRLTNEAYQKIVGKLFGYTEEATQKYIDSGDSFPQDNLVEELVDGSMPKDHVFLFHDLNFED